MGRSVEIRPADERDIAAVMALGREFWSGIRNPEPYRIDRVAAVLADLIAHHILLVACVDGVPVGFVAAQVSECPFSGVRRAVELAFYIHPRHRGAGLRLLKECEREAADRGAEYFTMICLSEDLLEGGPRVGRLYERMGFREAERWYRKDLR